jgi:cytochrome c peroxidase
MTALRCRSSKISRNLNSLSASTLRDIDFTLSYFLSYSINFILLFWKQAMRPRFYLSLALAFSTASFTFFGVASLGFGAAIVGETRQVSIRPFASPGTDALKALYRRPATIPFPKDNLYTPAKAALGKKLFFDTRLSVTSAQSCASCHNPGLGWGDGLALGVGHGMMKLGRRSPTIVNAAWGDAFMWDGRLATLEDQALSPIQSATVMDLPLDQLIKRLQSIPEYAPLFAGAFPQDGITPVTLAKAIATYERTVVSERAPFDVWIDGNEKAISEEAKRGFAVFNGKGQCAACHEGWNFTNDGFQDIGLSSVDVGRGQYLPGVIKMKNAFKTPGLREIARRAPYMHDGSLATLDEVVEHYDQGGINRESRSDIIKPLGLTTAEKSDLVAFLKSLTSNPTPTAVPVLPR